MGVAEAMRTEWDARAGKNAFYYIASWQKDWNISDFLKSGEEDYARLVMPVLNQFGFSPEGKTILELGCGAGRMARCFAKHFGRVLAFDVSHQMLSRAQELLPEIKNVSFFLCNGLDLLPTPDESVDFVFTYLVLQHLPTEKLVLSYVREMLRVLRPGGLCLFQFNSMKRPTMNWKGHLAWGAIDALWDLRLRSLSRVIAKRLRLDAEMAGKTWHGVAVPSFRVVETIRASGGAMLEVRGDDSPMAWCCAQKTNSLPAVIRSL